VLTNEINNAPATIALLNMSERKCRNLRPPEAAAEKNSQHSAVTQSPQGGDVRRAQEILRLPQRRPVTHPDSGGFHTLHSYDSRRQLRREQAIVCCLGRELTNGGQANADR
jgi:hypothetical protein